MSATNWDGDDLFRAAKTGDAIPIALVTARLGKPKDAWTAALFDFLIANAEGGLTPQDFSNLKRAR